MRSVQLEAVITLWVSPKVAAILIGKIPAIGGEVCAQLVLAVGLSVVSKVGMGDGILLYIVRKLLQIGRKYLFRIFPFKIDTLREFAEGVDDT